jgi:hypothetical protein
LEFLARAIRNERDLSPKGRLSLYADDMILYSRHSKTLRKNLLEIIYSFGKVAGYKINIQKSVAFVYQKCTD